MRRNDKHNSNSDTNVILCSLAILEYANSFRKTSFWRENHFWQFLVRSLSKINGSKLKNFPQFFNCSLHIYYQKKFLSKIVPFSSRYPSICETRSTRGNCLSASSSYSLEMLHAHGDHKKFSKEAPEYFRR